MSYPNVVPYKPSFHRITSQEIEKKDDVFIVNLTISCIGEVRGEYLETACFYIPLAILDSLQGDFAVFNLGRDVSSGWTLYYKKPEEKITRETIMVDAQIAHS